MSELNDLVIGPLTEENSDETYEDFTLDYEVIKETLNDELNKIFNMLDDIRKKSEELDSVLAVLRSFKQKPVILSNCAFNRICNEGLEDQNTIYYVLEPELGRYIRGYIEY